MFHLLSIPFSVLLSDIRDIIMSMHTNNVLVIIFNIVIVIKYTS